MKYLITTIAALVLVGCGGPPPKDIWEAAKQGDVDAVKQFIVAGEDVNAKDKDGGTPLDLAIADNKTETAKLLRKHGGKYGSIHTAANDGDTEAVKEFLATGVDVNAKDNLGSTSLHARGRTPLHRAASGGHKEVVELLIAEGADLEAKDADGFTPLQYAAADGRKKIAELLIAKGADVNAKRGAPLNAAILTKHTEIAELLRKHGAKTTKENFAAGN
jgi:ankyrin repeat protein